jgi:hypothetical protein
LDEPLSRYLITREEELIHLLVVGLERLAIFLRQVVEGRLDNVVLAEIGFVGVGTSFLHGWSSRVFSEVVKISSHTNRIGSRKLLLEIGKSDALFWQTECPISLILAAGRGTIGVNEEALPPAKRHLDGREGRITMNPRVVATATRSNWREERK